MAPDYKYTGSVDFINNLNYDFIESYSFQRGAVFETERKNNLFEYENLKIKKETSGRLSTSEEDRLSFLDSLLNFTQYLINDKGQFHPSSKKVNTFSATDANAIRIKNILLTEIKDVPQWLCAPLYRDALVFYNSSREIVSALNICLSCEYMEIKMFNYINADWSTYDQFKRFFIDAGHEVENPEYFALEDYNALKSKYKK